MRGRAFLSNVVFASALGIATGRTIVGRHGRDKFGLAPCGCAAVVP